MQRWALYALLSVVFAVSVHASCDRFDIRNSGQTLFAITSGSGLVSIPGDLELGSLATNQILMGDYVFGVHNVFGETQIGLRKRRVDADTGKYHVPRAIRGFAHNGTHVIYDHEFRDASEFSLAELRDFMREVLADELALEGHNDPFNLAARYTAAGEWCKEESFDCVPTREDMFVMVSSEESRVAMLDLQALWERDAEAGEAGYTGEVQRLTLIRTVDDYQTLANENGKNPGRSGFRLADSEVEDVFYLKAGYVTDFEVTPGVSLSIQGWAGGQVIDFTFGSDGTLTGGKIVVGPHPESDPNDVVVMQKTGFVGLETRTPGPAFRFTPGRSTRVYVHNALVSGTTSAPLSVHFGFITRHDQDGEYQFSQQAFTAATSPYVYEFVVPAAGSHLYYDSYDWNAYLYGAGVIAEASWDHDREYVLVAQASDMLNGNTFPGTAKRLSGWYRDTMRIKESKVDPDTKDTIVTIIDEARLPYEGSNDDPFHPVVQNDCPAFGGPLRYGTGCLIGGIHQNRGHNIPSATYSPGTAVFIEGHGDEARSTINGVHYVVRESLTSFRIQKLGEDGSSGGEGGFVHIWRLHKSSPYHPQLQNNGASGAYLRFNYEENVLVRVFNADRDAAHIHIHGHKFDVVAENGFTLGASRTETSYSVPAGNSADLWILADNPNRVNAWLLANDIQAESDIVLRSPWQDAEISGTGHATFVDYTGTAQGDLALTPDGQAVPLSWLPPVCTVESSTINVNMDNIGRAVGEGDDIWVYLGGAGYFATNPWTNQPFGDSVTYQWAKVSGPGNPSLFTPTEASTYVSGLAVGTTEFTLTVSGHNAFQTNPSVRVVCQKKVVVTVSPTVQNDLATLPSSFVSPAITALRLGVDVTPVTAKRTVMKSTPAVTGHATFKLNTARKLTATNVLTVAEFYATNVINPNGAWDPQDPNPLSPLYGTKSVDTNFSRNFPFYRWANQGTNTDFWLNINPAVSTSKAGWTFAIKQVVFDGRVQTFGYVLGADIGLGVAAGAQPPPRSSVYYPMYQGSSTARSQVHDVYFLILEASDSEFCEQFNCVYAPTLSLIPLNSEILNPAALRPGVANQYIRQRRETGTFSDQRATDFIFSYDPTVLPVLSASPNDPATTGGLFAYSPLKTFSWTNSAGVVKNVVANMPFVYWGNIDVQASADADALRAERRMLLVETDGCDDFIRGSAYRPETFPADIDAGLSKFETAGPPGCLSSDVKGTRQRGGQLLDVPNFRLMFVQFKTHRAAYDGAVVPYFTITDTSDLNEAQYHGVPFTPALSKLGAVPSAPYVSSYRQWGNGVAGAGLLGYQDAVVGSTPLATSWSPFWAITNLYWNCGTFNLATGGMTQSDIEATCYTGSSLVVDCGTRPIVGFDFFSFAPTGSCAGGDLAVSSTPACAQYNDATMGNCIGKTQCTLIAPSGCGSSVGYIKNCGTSEKYTKYDVLASVSDIYYKPGNILYNSLLSKADWSSDYYQLVSNLKTTTCAGYVKAQTGSTWTRATEIPSLLTKGALFETSNPGGSAASTTSPSILNAHIPYVFRPAAPRDSEDLVITPQPINGFWSFPGTWMLQWKKSPTETVNLAARPLIKGAPQYMQGDYGLEGDFPVNEPLTSTGGTQNCPNCAWMAIYDVPSGLIAGTPSSGSAYWLGQRALAANQRPFRLQSFATTITPAADIKFALLECNDAKFASTFGARYVADLPTAVATSSVWWEEPEAGDSGMYAAADVAKALGSFTFSEVPGDFSQPTGPAINALYTPLKLFTFQYRWVTCNMPFAVWGTQTAATTASTTVVSQRLLEDSGSCNLYVRKDPYGSRFQFFNNGPPSCAEQRDALQRVRGGQVIAWNLAAAQPTVTLKLHRTVNANDKKWSYYTVWDTTNAIEAGYLGVPVSPRLSAAVTGVETMKVFANGIECDGCNAYNFQEPIIGTGLSPIRKVTNLLWNCDNVLQSGSLFAASNLDQTACASTPGVIDCDNYPLRATLKGTKCDAYVQRYAPSGVVYATDNLTKWVADGVVFETLSPVGVAPTSAVPEYTNSPVVLTVDFN